MISSTPTKRNSIQRKRMKNRKCSKCGRVRLIKFFRPRYQRGNRGGKQIVMIVILIFRELESQRITRSIKELLPTLTINVPMEFLYSSTKRCLRNNAVYVRAVESQNLKFIIGLGKFDVCL